MKLNSTKSGNIQSNLAGSSSNFCIAANAKTFAVLSSTLYSNKIGSIIRELSCNAFDSHVAAGIPSEPFDIHVPSIFEPWFSIKDHGIGMSDEFVYETYTSYFKSTKDSANSVVGAFGIGGKSFFSYTDSAAITSIHNGMKRVYVAMIGEDGIPTITKMSESASKENNGVEVKITVKNEDIRTFTYEIASQLRFFPVKPTIVNAPNFAWDEINIKEKYGKMHITNGYGTYVVQGPVGYPLDTDNLVNLLTPDEMEFFNTFDSFIMNFNIGDIEVTPSREAISYSKHTVESIKRFIKVHSVLLIDDVKTKIANFKTDWEKISFLNSDASINRIAKSAGLTFGDKGKLQTKTCKVVSLHGKYYLDLKDFAYTTKSNITEKVFSLIKYRLKYNDLWERSTLLSPSDCLFTPENGTKIFIRDKCSSAIRRFKEHAGDNAYLIEHPQGTKFVDEKFVKLIQDAFGQCDVQMVSSLPGVTSNSAAYVGPPKAYKMPDGCYGIGSSVSNWIRLHEEIEDLDEGYYILMETYPYVEDNGQNDSMYKIYQLSKDSLPIYVIRKKDENKAKDNPALKPFVDSMKKINDDTLLELTGSKLRAERYNVAKRVCSIINTMAATDVVKHLVRCSAMIEDKDNEIYKIQRIKHIAERYLDSYHATKGKLSPVAQHVLSVEMENGVDVQQNKIIKCLNAWNPREVFENKYPLIKHLSYYSNCTRAIAEYVNLMDAKRLDSQLS